MSRTLLTGGSGLLGSRVARLLAQRGDELRLTVRERTPTEHLDFDYEAVRCDVLDRQAVRRAMGGVERVFHVAGLTSLRAPAAELFRVNVEGTRIVLEEALRAGVERVVHTSSIAAVGPAPRGAVADERQVFPAGCCAVPYVESKREAEVQALRLAARGLPVVIVNPAFVLGAGDLHGSSTDLVRRFLRREIQAYVDGALNIVDVGDVADGHLLAEEHGEIGERYILGNRNFTLDRLFTDLGRLSGVQPPAIKLPLPAAVALAHIAESLPGTPVVTATEVLAGGQWWAFSSAKAKRELGYSPGHHEDPLASTIAWYREHEERLAAPGTRQPPALRLAGFALRQAGGALRGLGL
ncbi:MAG TPA: NAD-dependent epimerase/dehydratase family protein [Solirubrobacteraceae bacterium]|nr:NAD-dependent epimerase/dehydratase family protein [Solirubrobacteraceae bacterium]